MEKRGLFSTKIDITEEEAIEKAKKLKILKKNLKDKKIIKKSLLKIK